MRVLPAMSRLLVTVLLLVIGVGSAAPVLGGEEPRSEEPTMPRRSERKRGIRAHGFGGLTPAEAQRAQALLDEGRAAENDGSYRRALGRYKRVWKRFPRSAAAPEALFRSAQIHIKQQKPTKAFEEIDAVVRSYPNFGRFNELVSEQYRIAYELVGGKRLKMFGILPGFPNRERGIQYMERLIANAPYSDYAPLALMGVAEAYARSGEADGAIDALDRLITHYPGSFVASDGYLRLAQMHERLVAGPLYDQGETREAIDNYEDFLILFPRDTKVGSAEQGLSRMREMLAQSRVKIGDFYYFKRDRYTAARVFYNEAITIAPNSKMAQLARERIANLDADEARAEARRVADAEHGRGGLFNIFRRQSPRPTPEPERSVTPSAPEGREESTPATRGELPPTSPVSPDAPRP